LLFIIICFVLILLNGYETSIIDISLLNVPLITPSPLPLFGERENAGERK
jgi:hypothetical protein